MQRLLGAVLAGVVAVGALTGCSHPRSSLPPADQTSSAAPSSTSSAYLETPTPTVSPYTAPGTQLRLGQTATVQWQPAGGTPTVIDLTVDQVQRSSFTDKAWKGWNVSKQTRASKPYFVRATVKDAGTTSLAGQPAPLYVLTDANQLLLPSTFKAAFTPCSPGTLPPHFGPGQSAKVCLVYLVPPGASYVGVAYRPGETDQPITWKGLTPAGKH